MKTRATIATIAIALLVIIAGVYRAADDQARLHSRARTQWKNQAVAEISRRSTNLLAITNEIAALRQESKKSEEGWWVGTNVLLMSNGEYFVYSDINAKEDGRITDLFIAHGSNDKWYYSTYHFCVHMISVRIDEAPGSIAAFETAYFAKEFDGRSDACLDRTWPLKK